MFIERQNLTLNILEKVDYVVNQTKTNLISNECFPGDEYANIYATIYSLISAALWGFLYDSPENYTWKLIDKAQLKENNCIGILKIWIIKK